MKDFIPNKEALELKTLGFDAEKCSKQDIGLCLAPTYSQAFRWFREKHKLHCWVGCKTLDNGETVYIGNGRTIPNTLIDGFVIDIIPYEPKPTPEEAELACLKKIIEIVKNKLK